MTDVHDSPNVTIIDLIALYMYQQQIPLITLSPRPSWSKSLVHGEEILNAGGVKHCVNRMPWFISQTANDSDTILRSLVRISPFTEGSSREKTPYTVFLS